MKPREDVVLELVRQWLLKADEDLAAAETLANARPPFHYPACFHAQQAAEKYLKALLTRYQVEFPKTHAIERLLDLLGTVDEKKAMELSDAVALTPYGVEIRYPGDQPEPDDEETQRALALARQVQTAIKAWLEESSAASP